MFPRFDSTTRFSVVEIEIPANSTKQTFKIDDQPDLRTDQEYDILIQGIETYTEDDLPFTWTGTPMASLAQLKLTYLTLYIDGEDNIYRMPLIQLHRIANAQTAAPVNVPYVYDMPRFNNVEISWDKCTLDAPPIGYGGANTLFSFQLGIHYLRLPPGTAAKLKAIQMANYCNLAPK